MQMIIKELVASGVNEDNILYFNLDKRPYMTINTPDKLDALIEKYINDNERKYLFIDEIQNVRNFETVINAWREEGNISIFITGSNSYLLSGELATKLTGRYIEVDMYPLTFEEYIDMKAFLGFKISDDAQELNNYILEGGFPYTLKLSSLADKRMYAGNLIEEIYQKDIKTNLKIRNRVAFDAIMKYFIANFGATTNLTNIVADLNKRGTTIKKETVNRYLTALENAKILIRCDRFDMKSRKSIMGDKKYYLADLSFYYAVFTDNKINYGPVLENIVHNYALSYGNKVSIGRFGKFECDFIIRNQNMDYSYVQVAYTILASEETENREYRPLELITWDNYPRYVMTTDKLIQKRNGIIHANIMDFMKAKMSF